MSALLGLSVALFAAIGLYHTARSVGRLIARGWKHVLGGIAKVRAALPRDSATLREIRALRAEVAALRGTTTPERPWYAQGQSQGPAPARLAAPAPPAQEISEADLEEFMRRAVNGSRPAA